MLKGCALREIEGSKSWVQGRPGTARAALCVVI